MNHRQQPPSIHTADDEILSVIAEEGQFQTIIISHIEWLSRKVAGVDFVCGHTKSLVIGIKIQKIGGPSLSLIMALLQYKYCIVAHRRLPPVFMHDLLDIRTSAIISLKLRCVQLYIHTYVREHVDPKRPKLRTALSIHLSSGYLRIPKCQPAIWEKRISYHFTFKVNYSRTQPYSNQQTRKHPETKERGEQSGSSVFRN
ncbi:hypothetical protein HOY82DRAFT_539745 [Tuber indicum]|nr:hypothetical protein HOY82DRAFT_539745 [Tuber indicum]